MWLNIAYRKIASFFFDTHPRHLTRLTMSLCPNTYMSDHFYMSNGVRQGSISSPKLFSVYIYVNDVLDALVTSQIECQQDNLCLNHVMYTDDIYLIKSGPEALQKLLNVFYDFSIGNNLSSNKYDNDMLRK